MWNLSKQWLINKLGGYTESQLKEYKALSYKRGKEHEELDQNELRLQLMKSNSDLRRRLSDMERVIFETAGASEYVSKLIEEVTIPAPNYDVHSKVSEDIFAIRLQPKEVFVLLGEEYPEVLIDRSIADFRNRVAPQIEWEIEEAFKKHLKVKETKS